MHFHRENSHIFSENARILCKLDENACIFSENAGKCTHFLRKTLPSRVTFINELLHHLFTRTPDPRSSWKKWAGRA